MQFSPNGRLFIEDWEGRRSRAYLDTGGKLTIGIGHLLTKSERQSGKIILPNETIKYADGLTDDQINRLFLFDLRRALGAVSGLVKVPLTQYQFDALVSFAFNAGVGAFQESTLLKILNKGQFDQVPEQMLRWVWDNGVKSNGLLNRRNDEVSLWNNQWRIKYNA